jgi:uncharacterized membrane protein HdeD (DUF308 family)
MAATSTVDLGRHASGWSIVWGVLLILLGLLATAAPFLAAVAVSVVIGWLIVLAGVVHIVVAFHSHGAGSVIWKLLVGIAYLCFGGYVLVHPVLGVASLTLMLAALFVIEGVLNLILFFNMRSVHGSAWVLIDGLITLALGVMIYAQWPSSSAWAIGILVGISMIFSGATRIGVTMAVRRAVIGVAPPTRLAA